MFSQSTRYLEELEQRVPIVGDKALIDLVNGIQINKDLIHYRKSRNWFGQLIEQLDGSDRKRQLLLDGNLIAGQEALYQWVLELSDSLKISQNALEITQTSLLEAREAIRRNKRALQEQKQTLQTLTQHFEQLARLVQQRLNQIETCIHQLEVRVTANEDLDRILSAWTAAQTYTNFPWALQITFLSRELFTSAIATYELETGDIHKYRPLLVNKILSASDDLPKSFFTLADLLDISCREIQESDRDLCAALLEVRSIPLHRLQNTPHLFTLGTTLELATLPNDAKPAKPGQTAIALCRSQIDSLSRTTDAREFVTAIVTETANDSLATLTRK